MLFYNYSVFGAEPVLEINLIYWLGVTPIREWFLDYPETEIHHRHVSHLYGLYPGNLITEKTPELLEACRVALERRGDEGTGWCMAWKACLWARLRDGEHALGLLKNQPLYQGGKYFLCGRRHLSQYAVCTPTVSDRWELWLCSCGCRDAYPEQERAYPVASGTSGWMERRKCPGNEGTGWHHSWFRMERWQDTQGSPLFFPWAESSAGM